MKLRGSSLKKNTEEKIMPPVDSELKYQAEAEAARRTEVEQRRIDYYRSLRYSFCATSVDKWLGHYFEQHEATYKPQKDPSWNQIRKNAGIGFLEYSVACLSKDKKKKIADKMEESRSKLKKQVDAANECESERCRISNDQLHSQTIDKSNRLDALDPFEVQDFFGYAIEIDSYSLDCINQYPQRFSLMYVPKRKRLVIDYELPTMDYISKNKEWKVGRNNEITAKEMNKTDYLEMYERILFDLSIRVIGILFESDSRNVIDEVVFNGSCIYHNWQSRPTVILSFLVTKDSYSYEKIRKMDFASKVFVSKLAKIEYLDDVNNKKAPADLWETPPSKIVIPIQSSL